MFAECDWNDDVEAQALSQSVFHKVEASCCIGELSTRSPGGKKKRRFLQTLRTLSAAGTPDQDPGETPPNTVYGAGKSKRKKKRNRFKKDKVRAKLCEPDVGKGSGDPVKSPSAPADVAKENRSERMGAKENGHLQAGNSEFGEGSSAAQQKVLKVNGLGSHSGQGELTRKQWRNRMKNKHRNKNKFRSTDPPPAGNREQMEETIEYDRTLTKSGPEQEEEKSVSDRHVAKIKRRKGRGKGSEPGERTASQSSNGNMTNLRKRAGDHSQEGDTLSLCKQTRRNAAPDKILTCQPSDCVPSQSDSLARVSLPTGGVNSTQSGLASPSTDRSAALRTKMEERLKSARFRYINEQLYTSSSAEAVRLFAQDKKAFEIYHRGFTTQIERWPENPLNRIIQYIRDRSPSAVVADFGCGDCKLARSVSNKVYSFDLVALNQYVTVCDIASVPLAAESVDVVVFCLALMGSNLLDFLVEASRVLKLGGILKIAEVASRFEDVRSFVNILGSLGFKIISKDTANNYFYLFDFRKSRSLQGKDKLPQLQLKPCLYKKR